MKSFGNNRMRMFAALLLALPLMLCCRLVAQSAARDASEGVRTPTVLVLPFENSAKQPNVEWIGESFPEVLGSRFDGSGLFVISREDRLYAFDKMGVPAVIKPSLATLYLIAQQIDADYIVLGSFTVEQKSFKAQAQVLDMKELRLSPVVEQRGELDQLIDIQNRLAWELLKSIRPQAESGRQRFLESYAPIRLDAFENYIRGLQATTRQEKIHRFRAAVELNPSYYAASLQLGRIYLAARDYDAASEVLTAIPESDDGYAEANFLLGLSYYYLGMYEKSGLAFERTQARMAIGDVYNNLGVVASRRGKNDALAYFKKAVESDGSDEEFLFNLAVAQCKAGDDAGAKTSLEEAQKLQPNDSEARQFLETLKGAAAKESSVPAAKLPLPRIRRNYDENAYRQLVLEMRNIMAAKLSGSDPGRNAAEHLALARHFLESGQLNDAEKEYREALGHDATSAEAHAGVAHVFELKGDAKKAREEAGRSIQFKPTAEAYLVLARLNIKENHPAAAAQNIDQALWVEPDNAEALELKHLLAKPEHR